MSILGISKTLMYGFWYDHIKVSKVSKYQNKTKLHHMDTDSFIIHIKTKDFYKDLADDVEKWFDTFNSNEDNKRPLSIGNKKKKIVILFERDELRGKIMIKLAVLRPKK